MNARVTLTADELAEAGLAPFRHAPAAIPQPDPAPGPYDQVLGLIKSVFAVPAVSILLEDGQAGTEPGVWGAFLDAPLLREGQVVGRLRLLDDARRSFDLRDRALLEGFARLVVEQADLIARATRDGLTGARTRRAFHEDLDRALAIRRRAPAALVMFDLDHFKSVNDTLGHAAGDAVLRAAARVVQRELRPEDSFGRVGGEEFAVLLSGADQETGLDVAERIRAAIARMRVPGHDGLQVTASFGVAALTDLTPSADALMAAADRALYAAKSAGRNRVEAGQVAPATLM